MVLREDGTISYAFYFRLHNLFFFNLSYSTFENIERFTQSRRMTRFWEHEYFVGWCKPYIRDNHLQHLKNRAINLINCAITIKYVKTYMSDENRRQS